MTKKKAKKKTESEPVVEEKPGEEVKSEPALVDEPVVKVRSAIGVRTMTLSEYKKQAK